MATAFNQQQRAQIQSALMKAATDCAATLGMRKTTVEQLSEAAGISKGAFYKFYECKETLFLDVLENLHEQMYGSAERVMLSNPSLCKRERVALAVKQVLRELESHRMIAFFQDDLPALLRKLPKEELKEHYHSDVEHIKRLLEKGQLDLTRTVETACTVVMILLRSLTTKVSFGGEPYDEAIELLIDGACAMLIKE